MASCRNGWTVARLALLDQASNINDSSARSRQNPAAKLSDITLSPTYQLLHGGESVQAHSPSAGQVMITSAPGSGAVEYSHAENMRKPETSISSHRYTLLNPRRKGVNLGVHLKAATDPPNRRPSTPSCTR